jgi:hypothetical protein
MFSLTSRPRLSYATRLSAKPGPSHEIGVSPSPGCIRRNGPAFGRSQPGELVRADPACRDRGPGEIQGDGDEFTCGLLAESVVPAERVP